MSTAVQSHENHVGGARAHGTGASEMPHGGFKQSGYGKDRSIDAVEEHTNITHVGISLT